MERLIREFHLLLRCDLNTQSLWNCLLIFLDLMVMSHPSGDSTKRGPDVRNSSSSSSGVGDEKSREGRPQEDDTLSSILLMLKSNTNDDDDDVATDDLEVKYFLYP